MTHQSDCRVEVLGVHGQTQCSSAVGDAGPQDLAEQGRHRLVRGRRDDVVHIDVDDFVCQEPAGTDSPSLAFVRKEQNAIVAGNASTGRIARRTCCWAPPAAWTAAGRPRCRDIEAHQRRIDPLVRARQRSQQQRLLVVRERHQLIPGHLRGRQPSLSLLSGQGLDAHTEH